MMQPSVMVLVAVGAGGAAGALARYCLGIFVASRYTGAWPLGTLLVNLIGAFAIGLCFALVYERSLLDERWAPVLMAGFLGGLTTFSTFSLETLSLLQRGQTGLALAYSLGSVVLCVLLTYLGVLAARSLPF